MKIRIGFVSNSSSSSYLAYIPSNAKIDLEKYINKYDIDYWEDRDDFDKKKFYKYIHSVIEGIRTGASIREEDDYDHGGAYDFIINVLSGEDLVIYDFDAAPSSGGIYAFSNEIIGRLEEIEEKYEN